MLPPNPIEPEHGDIHTPVTPPVTPTTKIGDKYHWIGYAVILIILVVLWFKA
jgi:hypothetical protein